MASKPTDETHLQAEIDVLINKWITLDGKMVGFIKTPVESAIKIYHPDRYTASTKQKVERCAHELLSNIPKAEINADLADNATFCHALEERLLQRLRMSLYEKMAGLSRQNRPPQRESNYKNFAEWEIGAVDAYFKDRDKYRKMLDCFAAITDEPDDIYSPRALANEMVTDRAKQIETRLLSMSDSQRGELEQAQQDLTIFLRKLETLPKQYKSLSVFPLKPSFNALIQTTRKMVMEGEWMLTILGHTPASYAAEAGEQTQDNSEPLHPLDKELRNLKREHIDKLINYYGLWETPYHGLVAATNALISLASTKDKPKEHQSQTSALQHSRLLMDSEHKLSIQY